MFFTPARREAVLRGLSTNHYGALAPGRTAFDTDRGWTARLDLLAQSLPDVRMICCVRHVPCIIDSVERLVRRNPFDLSKIFNFDPGGTVCSRAEAMMAPSGLIGFPLAALKRAMHGDHSRRLLLVPYDMLVADPAAALDAVYRFTGVVPFRHNLEGGAFEARAGRRAPDGVAKKSRVSRHLACTSPTSTARRSQASPRRRQRDLPRALPPSPKGAWPPWPRPIRCVRT